MLTALLLLKPVSCSMERSMGKQPTTNRGWEAKPGTLAEGRPNRQTLCGARGVDVWYVREGLGAEVEGPGLA
jgi:hypothetical protein